MAAVQDGKVIRAIQVGFLSVIKLYMFFFLLYIFDCPGYMAKRFLYKQRHSYIPLLKFRYNVHH